ncbi:MAG: right-handed parallel beta-helix repeat-containing protein [Phycisphaerales bacterium]
MTIARTVAFVLAAACSSAALAGDLTPPGAPTSTMKTLDQVEPRTPIGQADVPFTITRAGSYYLTENLFPANLNDPFVIEVAADDVTLDLMGFRIEGATEVTTANYGVAVNTQVQNVVVRDGTITKCRFSGVEALLADGVNLESLRLTFNGTDGARVGDRSRVENCTAFGNENTGVTVVGGGVVIRNTIAEGNAIDGIDAGASTSIENCTADSNGRYGILVAAGSTAVNCTALNNGQDGFFTVGGSVLTGCAAYANGLSGFRSNARATFIECSAISNDEHGFELSSSAVVRDCSSNQNAMSGFHLADGVDNCRIEGNSATGNNIGFAVVGAANVVVGNNAATNGFSDYVIVAGNLAGPIVTSANIAANTNPSANYEQ